MCLLLLGGGPQRLGAVCEVMLVLPQGVAVKESPLEIDGKRAGCAFWSPGDEKEDVFMPCNDDC